MSASEIERTRCAWPTQIVEKSNGSGDLALVGIQAPRCPIGGRGWQAHLYDIQDAGEADTGVAGISNFTATHLTTADVRPVATPGAIGFDVEGRDRRRTRFIPGARFSAALVMRLSIYGRAQLAVTPPPSRELPIEAT